MSHLSFSSLSLRIDASRSLISLPDSFIDLIESAMSDMIAFSPTWIKTTPSRSAERTSGVSAPPDFPPMKMMQANPYSN